MRFYLSGSMFGLFDSGGTYRERWERDLKAMGHEVFNPVRGDMEAIQGLFETEKEAKYVLALFRSSPNSLDEATLNKVALRLRQYDLDAIKTCDALLVNFSRESAGTCREIEFAWEHKIPVYFVYKLPYAQINTWLRPFITERFRDWGDLCERIAEVYAPATAKA